MKTEAYIFFSKEDSYVVFDKYDHEKRFVSPNRQCAIGGFAERFAGLVVTEVKPSNVVPKDLQGESE